MTDTAVARSQAPPTERSAGGKHASASRATRMNALADIAGPQFTIGEHQVGRRAVLVVAGEVDMCTAANLRMAIEAAGTRAFEVWVDLTDTTFMDSSGLHAMAEARAQLLQSNRRLALICPQGPVLRVLTLTGLDQIFETYASRRAANYAFAT
jgi:anti-sigma B factor antagonist